MKHSLVIVLLFFLTAAVSANKPKTGIKTGNLAPDLSGKSFTGESYTLSEIRGKVVLIDFWASWCRPCRVENPVVVKAYRKFKNKRFVNAEGFTVFSVSLDRTQSAWERGVHDDKLEWPYHISDLKGWYSKHAALYGVRAIPSNFLIDGDGKIIASDLKGPALEAELNRLVR